MAEPRTIACPHCDAERTTKAGAGQRVRCPGCGRLFLVPRTSTPAAAMVPGAPGPAGVVDLARGDPPADPAPPPAAPSSTSSETVVVADEVTITKAAKPRPPRPVVDVDELAKDDSATEPPPPSDPPRIPAAVSGRRGGLGSAMYRKVKRRG